MLLPALREMSLCVGSQPARHMHLVLCDRQRSDATWRAQLETSTSRDESVEKESARLSAIFSAAAEGRVSDPGDTLAEMRAIGGHRCDRYGEITPRGFTSLGNRLRLGPADVFADLGSGIGKAVVQSVAQFGAQSAVGVELSPARHSRALAALEAVPVDVASRVRLHCGDCAAQSTWEGGPLSDASVVWMCSALFSDALMDRIAHRLTASRVRTVATLRRFPHGVVGYREDARCEPCEMSWTASQESPDATRWKWGEDDGAPVYVYEREACEAHFRST